MVTDASIIITSYNVERYIGRAIASALAQVDVAVEVIVVDDASSDGTWQIISAVNDPRVRSFKLEANGGPGAARNKGLSEAKGEWIAVLDGDDAFEPNRLRRCIDRACAAKADIVVDNLLVCREADGKEFPMFAPEHFAALNILDLATFVRGTLTGSGNYTLGYVKPVFSAAFVRAQQLKYDAALRIGEDYLILVQALALNAKCVVEPEAGYRYTVRAGSISHRLSLANLDAMIAADAAFVSQYSLDAKARKAQARRSFLQKEMRAYIQLVAAIKSGAPAAALKAVAASPSCVRHLWEPIAKRLKNA